MPRITLWHFLEPSIDKVLSQAEVRGKKSACSKYDIVADDLNKFPCAKWFINIFHQEDNITRPDFWSVNG